MALNLQNASFYRAASAERDFVRDGLPQIVFAGRSNVGKSSVINRLLNRKNLAHVGASPGKTTRIQYYALDGKGYLVDLPGYGYAKVSRTERAKWGQLMEQYFQSGHITLGILIVDARHKPTADDCTMHQWFRDSGCPERIIANKTDKLKARQLEPSLALIRQTLVLDENELIPFSAEKGTGKETLLRAVLHCFA